MLPELHETSFSRLSVFWILALAMSLFRAASWAEETPKLPAVADTLSPALVQKDYADGNFESLTRDLEAFRVSGRSIRKSDSLLLCKYLGVIYAANPATREKGKYWLNKMLETDPQSDIVDLYVSDEIHDTFDRVHREFLTRRHYLGLKDPNPNPPVAVRHADRTDTVVVRDTVVLQAPERRGQDEAAPIIPVQRWVQPNSWTWNLNGSLGKKYLEAAWDPVNEQTEVAANLDFRQQGWPVNVVVDWLFSYSETGQDTSGRSYRSRSSEIHGGVRKILDHSFFSMRPFYGLGLTYAAVEMTGTNFSPPLKLQNWGLWAQSGVYWELERHLNVGLNLAYSYANVLYVDQKVNAGGMHVGLLLGFHY